MGMKTWNPIKAMGIGENKSPHRRRATGLEISTAMAAALKEFIFYPHETDGAAMLDMKLELQELFLKYLNNAPSLQSHGELAKFDREHDGVYATK